MKIKGIISAVLILFVAASVVTLLVKGTGEEPEGAEQSEAGTGTVSGEAAATQTAVEQAGHAIVAYYFHGNFRCATCRKIEAYSREAIEASFAKEIESGVLVWRPVNVDETPNKHFAHDYDLTTRSLVLSEVDGGKEIKWKNLEKVWDLVGNKDKFFEYVQDETAAYLESI